MLDASRKSQTSRRFSRLGQRLPLRRTPSSLASGVVVTSMPCRRSPTAMAFVQFSSRRKRIVRAISFPCLESVLEPRRLLLSLLLVPLAVGHNLRVNLFAVVMVVRKSGVDVGNLGTVRCSTTILTLSRPPKLPPGHAALRVGGSLRSDLSRRIKTISSKGTSVKLRPPLFRAVRGSSSATARTSIRIGRHPETLLDSDLRFAAPPLTASHSCGQL
jgi:hypothetical protein